MKKEIQIDQFVKELLERIDAAKDINCCKTEIKTFCEYVVEKLGQDKITIDWKE